MSGAGRRFGDDRVPGPAPRCANPASRFPVRPGAAAAGFGLRVARPAESGRSRPRAPATYQDRTHATPHPSAERLHPVRPGPGPEGPPDQPAAVRAADPGRLRPAPGAGPDPDRGGDPRPGVPVVGGRRPARRRRGELLAAGRAGGAGALSGAGRHGGRPLPSYPLVTTLCVVTPSLDALRLSRCTLLAPTPA